MRRSAREAGHGDAARHHHVARVPVLDAHVEHRVGAEVAAEVLRRDVPGLLVVDAASQALALFADQADRREGILAESREHDAAGDHGGDDLQQALAVGQRIRFLVGMIDTEGPDDLLALFDRHADK